MPSGERYRLTLDGRKVDLSPIQFDLLSKKAINPASKSHNTLQSLSGMQKQGLLVKRAGRFVKTALGLAVLAELKMRARQGNGNIKE